MNIFTGNRHKIVIYAPMCAIYILLHTLVLLGFTRFSISLFDAILHCIMFFPIILILKNVMKYGNYSKIPFFQQIINYFALALLLIAIWIGVPLGLDFMFFDNETTAQLIDFLPFYILTGFLLCIIFIQFFKIHKSCESKEITSKNLKIIDENQEKKPAKTTENLERIAVKSGQKINVILVADIIYLQAYGDYVYIFTNEGKQLKEQTMKFFEDNLPANFVRVHRSYIVNIEAISRIELYEKQNQLITLKNGQQLKTSISGYKLLKNKLKL